MPDATPDPTEPSPAGLTPAAGANGEPEPGPAVPGPAASDGSGKPAHAADAARTVARPPRHPADSTRISASTEETGRREVRRENIPRPTVRRLSLYLRELEGSIDGPTVSSRQLASSLGLTDAQVRKDLAYFGQFGQPGIGYRHAELVDALRQILGTDRTWPTAVVGAGNLGRAVTSYARLGPKGFRVVAVFDTSPDVVGQPVGDLVVRPMVELPATIAEHEIQVAMLAVPGDAADDVARVLADTGIRGILNFAPVRLDVPEGVSVVSVDLTVALEQLAYKLSLGLPGAEHHDEHHD